MLAELVDHVIGVDPDRDWITLAIIDAHTTGVIAEAKFPASSDGYRDAVDMVDAHSSETERVWAIEGSAGRGSRRGTDRRQWRADTTGGGRRR